MGEGGWAGNDSLVLLVTEFRLNMHGVFSTLISFVPDYSFTCTCLQLVTSLHLPTISIFSDTTAVIQWVE